MPQSFHLETVSRDYFDCSVLEPLRDLSGVDEYSVAQTPRDGQPGARIAC
jgi:hypothetical protein